MVQWLRNLPANARNTSYTPGLGWSQDKGLLSPYTTTAESVNLCSTTGEGTTMRSLHTASKSSSLIAATKESPGAARKTQYNQKKKKKSSKKEVLTFKKKKLLFCSLKAVGFKMIPGASLVAQGWRIRTPMQETWLWSLVRKDLPHRGATKPECHNYWACAPTAVREASATRSLRTAAREEPRSQQPEKAHAQQRRPRTTKN